MILRKTIKIGIFIENGFYSYGWYKFHCTVLYCTVLYCTVLYCFVLYYCINVLWRDESVCIYTNAAFLAVADSKRLVLFNVKTGKFVGIIYIPCHLEKIKGILYLYSCRGGVNPAKYILLPKVYNDICCR